MIFDAAMAGLILDVLADCHSRDDIEYNVGMTLGASTTFTDYNDVVWCEIDFDDGDPPFVAIIGRAVLGADT